MKFSEILDKMLHSFAKNDTIKGVPLDQLQLEAASDRLEQRSQELQEESDKLTKMIKRIKRSRSGAR